MFDTSKSFSDGISTPFSTQPSHSTTANVSGSRHDERPMKHVALLIASAGAYGRGILSGIAAYNRKHGGWSIFFRPRGLNEPLPKWIGKWKGDGIIAGIDNAEVAQQLIKGRIPTVNLRGTLSALPIPYVSTDNNAVAQLAAEHLLERGVRNFGFVGKRIGTNPSLDLRGATFRHQVESHGHVCHWFHGDDFEARGWEVEQHELTEWVRSLPKPVGIMACNDERGLQVLDACQRAGVSVPDEVAVIGVDNDVCLCDLSGPPLTSVDVNAEMVGYKAAEMLDRMMQGQKVTEHETLVAPRSVVTRRSTDVVASEDEEVSRAISYIRAHAFKRIHAADVLKYLGVSRTSLQQRMKALTGRTIHQEVQHVRLQRAQDLLATSTMTIKRVARESGFASVQYMTRVFHAQIGETPARYRNQRAVNQVVTNAG